MHMSVQSPLHTCSSRLRNPAYPPQTLALASLSLASKGTEAPRRLREFLLPAWRLLQSSNASAEPLTLPSVLYDSLRATVVEAELILLRVLKFELRIPLPLEYLPRYLDRTIGEINAGSGGWGGTEDYDGFDKEHHDEYKIADLMETGIARAARAKITDACVASLPPFLMLHLNLAKGSLVARTTSSQTSIQHGQLLLFVFTLPALSVACM